MKIDEEARGVARDDAMKNLRNNDGRRTRNDEHLAREWRLDDVANLAFDNVEEAPHARLGRVIRGECHRNRSGGEVRRALVGRKAARYLESIAENAR